MGRRFRNAVGRYSEPSLSDTKEMSSTEQSPDAENASAPLGVRAPPLAVGSETAPATAFPKVEEKGVGRPTVVSERGGAAPRGTLPSDARTFPSEPETPEDLTGVVLQGRYRLDRILGTGGMGKVFLGHHLTLDVPIAVKLMHRSVAAVRENVLRFGREAQATSRLQHRNVVRVLDFGEAFGLLFIVMEFLAGETLASYASRASRLLPLDDVVDILTQVLTALEVAHELGIVHRDLKPENIFLMSEIGGARVVKVVDFGLAHVDDATGTETLTKADAVAGTPLYMSPEQCRSLAVGPSTDLYAIGCILTELLQGEPPFLASTPMDILTKQLFMPPPPLRRPPTAEPVPLLLERLRNDLLAKSPERRPASATDAKARLEEAMSPERTEAILPGRQGQTGYLDRTARLPRWSNPAPPLSEPAASDAPQARVFFATLSPGSAAIDDSLQVGLLSSGIALTRSEQSADLVVLDAGDDLAGAERWLRDRAGALAIVCVKNAGADGLGRLIAAGAADVVAHPVAIDALHKRVVRVLKRRR